jgi:uncharacterized protein (TIGR03435 family)
MMPRILCACLITYCVGFGQEPAGKPEFEVASIKPAQAPPMGMMRVQMNADAGMLRYTNVSLRDCIRVAYRVKDYQIQGPDWIASVRFDIMAKLPAGSSKDQIPEMLEALLADRFKLALHRDTKDHPIYALVVAKGGPKLKPAEVLTGDKARFTMAPGANPSKGGIPAGAMAMQIGPGGAHLKAPSATLGNLAEAISRFSDRPVIDMTGIQGQYDFDLAFSPESMGNVRAAMGGLPPPPPGPGPAGGPAGGGEHSPSEAPAEPAPSIYESVQRYGLKLEPRKAPIEILIVDHIERTPTEN